MLANYGYIGLFLIVCILFAVVAILLPLFLRLIKVIPRKRVPAKHDTYECGMETVGRSWVQFNFRYYVYALMLIALDVLVIFLYPWAAEFSRLGLLGFGIAITFILIIIVGYLYAWKKGMLEWK